MDTDTSDTPDTQVGRSGKRCISTYVDTELYAELKQLSVNDGRSLSNALANILSASLKRGD